MLLLVVARLGRVFVGDDGPDEGGGYSPAEEAFVALEIRGGSLHLSRNACVMLCR
jgi:hypothetical protein